MIYEKEIEGMTVKLRSIRVEDAEITCKMRLDKKKTKFMHQIEGTVEDQRQYIMQQQKKEGDYLFVVLDQNNQVIGMRGIYDVKDDCADSGRTIGYGDAFQNMEALLLGLDFAFYELNVKKVYMDAATNNQSIRGIQKKLGATEYKRGYYEGVKYEFVFSVLTQDDYSKSRERILDLISKHMKRKKIVSDRR